MSNGDGSEPDETSAPPSPEAPEDPAFEPLQWTETLGRAVLDGIEGVYDYLRHLVLTIRGIKNLRVNQVVHECSATGIEALPILILIGFLMGLIMAMRTATKLAEFGASIYVADLVATSMFRAIGPLLTGVIVAGRSASAFAAEVGTRKINDEVAALETMGLDVHSYLFSPKLIAALLVMPFITFLTSSLGITGGFTYSVAGYFMTPQAYIYETIKALSYNDIIVGSMKGMVYGGIIAIVGCTKGFAVQRGAPQVGKAARGAVVISIILLIVADAIFTIVLQTG